MSITVFLAFCILGCDFLLYVLFQWIYGEKHRKHVRRVAAHRQNRRTLSGEGVEEARVLPFRERAMQHRTGFF
jgi:hypothetical protein